MCFASLNGQIGKNQAYFFHNSPGVFLQIFYRVVLYKVLNLSIILCVP